MKTHSICNVPHQFYVNLILLVMGLKPFFVTANTWIRCPIFILIVPKLINLV